MAQLKRRAMRAEREAEETAKAREQAPREPPPEPEPEERGSRRGTGLRRDRERDRDRGRNRERPARPARKPAPAPEPAPPEIVIAPLGPSIVEALESARGEETAARAELERVQAAAGDNGEPNVELVDAEAELERASEAVAALEQRLELARERVERTARSQLKRSTRGALRDATARLAGALAEGEEVVYMAAGGQREGRRLLAATDRRLVVIDTTDAAPQAVSYDKVESAQIGRRGTLEVSTANGELKLDYVVGDLPGLVQHVNQRIWDVLHSSS
jgi:hypothetical protein